MDKMYNEYLKIMKVIQNKNNQPQHRHAIREIVRTFRRRWLHTPNFVEYEYYYADMLTASLELLTRFSDEEQF
jgi:hypothetical protein